jgi:thioredoxin-related protein
LLALLIAVSPAPTFAQIGDEVLPPAFVETLLELPDDAAQAAKSGKRLLLYFGQQGCPYCKELMSTSFTQKDITDKLAKHFVAIGFDLFGDREVTWFDGKVRSEKELAKFLKVQFTPTVLLLDEKGGIIAASTAITRRTVSPPRSTTRRSGWKASCLRRAHEDRAADRRQRHAQRAALLHEAAPRPAAQAGGKPLAVLFESRHCAPCDELHKEGFKREATRAAMASFDVARFSIAAATR